MIARTVLSHRTVPAHRTALSTLAMLASLGLLAGSAGAAQRMVTSTSLLRVAFSSATVGVGLFERERYPATGPGPQRCSLYTRATQNGGSSFGARGATLVHFNCANGMPLNDIAIDGPHLLLAYGPRLEISRDMGTSWKTSALPGALAGLALHGRSLWALVTRCRLGARHCLLTLLHSTSGGAGWRTLEQQPPDRLVDGAVAAGGEHGTAALMAATPAGGLVLALPAPSRGPNLRTPPLATVEELPPAPRHAQVPVWRAQNVPCPAGDFGTQLSVAPDGSQWLACTSQPATGLQPKAMDLSTDAGGHWRRVASACDFGTACRQRMPIGGYLDGLCALSSSTAFYVGARSSLTATFDGGRSWRVWPRIGGDATATLQVTFFGRRTGWAVVFSASPKGASGLWRTRDGGASWSRA